MGGFVIHRLGIVLCLAVAAASATAAAQTATVPGKSFLWKVQSGSKLVYLAGSVHALSADVYPLSPAFERAFADSDTLVEEIDLAEAETLTAAPASDSEGPASRYCSATPSPSARRSRPAPR